LRKPVLKGRFLAFDRRIQVLATFLDAKVYEFGEVSLTIQVDGHWTFAMTIYVEHTLLS